MLYESPLQRAALRTRDLLSAFEEKPVISGLSFFEEEESADGDDFASIKSAVCAKLMVDELLDDGTILPGNGKARSCQHESASAVLLL
jgi:hypothetical protein